MDTLAISLSNRLQKPQNKPARVFMGVNNGTPGSEINQCTRLGTAQTSKSKIKSSTKVLNGLAPSLLAELLVPKIDIAEYDLYMGSHTSLQLPLPRSEKLKKSFSFAELTFRVLYFQIGVMLKCYGHLRKEYALTNFRTCQTCFSIVFVLCILL